MKADLVFNTPAFQSRYLISVLTEMKDIKYPKAAIDLEILQFPCLGRGRLPNIKEIFKI